MKKRRIIKSVSVFMLLSLMLGGCSLFGDREKGNPSTEKGTTTKPKNVVSVTFPEGYAVTQIAQLLEEKGVCGFDDFIEAVNNPPVENEFVKSIKNPEERAFLLEGYVFPDTYDFYLNEGGKAALNRFLKNMGVRATQEYKNRAAELGYSFDEILTIASIIQKEAGMVSQMKKVSSVLHNRLNTKHPDYQPLRFDVTITYLKSYVIPYLTGDVNRYNELYNTYKCPLLPAGPIANPGIAAIEAALYPDETDYFYFVTDEESNYYYAKTYKEHRENCREVGLIG